MGDLGASKPAIPDVLYDSTYKTGTTVQIVSSATVDTFGSYVQISADVGIGKKILGIVISPEKTSEWINDNIEIEIADGASSSEVVISRVGTIPTGGNTDELVIFIPLNRTIRDNERLSARVRDSENTARTTRVYIYVGDAE